MYDIEHVDNGQFVVRGQAAMQANRRRATTTLSNESILGSQVFAIASFETRPE